MNGIKTVTDGLEAATHRDTAAQNCSSGGTRSTHDGAAIRAPAAPRGGRQTGFSLIEVLVTLLVMTVSLLGMAMLQGQSARFVSDAAVRSQASALIYDIIDRIRMNPSNANAYTSGDPGGDCDTVVVSVANDLNCWYQAVVDTLPQGGGSIMETSTEYRITVSWQDRAIRRGDGTPVTRQLQVAVEL